MYATHNVRRPEPTVPFMGTTDHLAPKDRLDYWCELVSERVVPLEFKPSGVQAFNASLRSIQIGEMHLSLVDAAPHTAVRSVSTIARSGAESIVLNFLLSGWCEATQDGRSTHIPAGSATFFNASRPYNLSFGEPFRVAALTMPQSMLANGVACPDRATAQDLAQRSELYPLVTAYIGQLIASPPSLDPSTAMRVSQNLADLISAMIAETVQQSPIPLSEHRTVAVTQIRAFVDRNLSNPDLSPNVVSEALRMSPRHINRLLAAEGTSLGRLIWRMRLDRIAIELRDPALASRSISEIAYSRGFNDMTHFSKIFRQAFGVSPRDYRLGVRD